MNKLNSFLLRHARLVATGAFVVCVSVFTFWAQLGAELDIRQDDHRIIFSGSDRPLHDQVRDLRIVGFEPTLKWALLSDATENSRFRPITEILEILLPRIIGTDSARWHRIWLVLVGIVSVMTFVAALKVFGTLRTAALVTLMIMLAPDPGPARVWYMMSTKAEAIGALFTICSIIAIANAARGANRRAWDFFGVICAALAGLSKESFVLVLPALAAIRVFLETRAFGTTEWESTCKLARLMLVYAIVFLVLLSAIGLSLAASPANNVLRTSLLSSSIYLDGFGLILRHLPQQSVWFIPAILGAYSLSRSFSVPSALRASVPILVLSAIWIIPQFFLYATRGGMWDHYWLPCIIGIVGLNGAALAYLGRAPNKWLFRIAFVSVILWMGNGIRVNFQAVENFANRTHAHQEALKYIVERTPSSGKILIFEEGAIATGEYAFSWVFFLAHEGRPNTKVFLYDSKNEDRGRFAKTFFFPYGDTLVSIPACEFDSIIFLTQPKESDIDWKRWYAEGCHEIHTVIGKQRHLSLKQRRWTTGEFTVTVATKTQLSQ